MRNKGGKTITFKMMGLHSPCKLRTSILQGYFLNRYRFLSSALQKGSQTCSFQINLPPPKKKQQKKQQKTKTKSKQKEQQQQKEICKYYFKNK